MWLYIFQFLGGVENVDPGLNGLTVFGNNQNVSFVKATIKTKMSKCQKTIIQAITKVAGNFRLSF